MHPQRQLLPFRDAESLLGRARAAAAAGDQALARRLAAEAVERCRGLLLSLGVSLSGWADWRAFALVADPRANALDDTQIDRALSLLGAMGITLEAAIAAWNLEAAVAESLEDLLDQVWRCEREWDFDDRIRLAAESSAGRPVHHPPLASRNPAAPGGS